MAVNQHVNKVILNGTTLMDVSDTTITDEDLMEGVTATMPDGSVKSGKMRLDDLEDLTDARGGIRYNNGNYQVYDVANKTWVDLSIGSSGGDYGSFVKLADVTNTHIQQDIVNICNILQWSDPENVVITGVQGEGTFAEWAGTKIVRKEGSAPQSPSDGITVLDNKIKDQYLQTGYVDSVPAISHYYYRFFPYTVDNKITYGSVIDYDMNIPSWSTGTDEEIDAVLTAYENGLIDLYEDLGWRVGDTRPVHIDNIGAVVSYSSYGSYTIPAHDNYYVLVDRKPKGYILTDAINKKNDGLSNVPEFAITTLYVLPSTANTPMAWSLAVGVNPSANGSSASLSAGKLNLMPLYNHFKSFQTYECSIKQKLSDIVNTGTSTTVTILKKTNNRKIGVPLKASVFNSNGYTPFRSILNGVTYNSENVNYKLSSKGSNLITQYSAITANTTSNSSSSISNTEEQQQMLNMYNACAGSSLDMRFEYYKTNGNIKADKPWLLTDGVTGISMGYFPNHRSHADSNGSYTIEPDIGSSSQWIYDNIGSTVYWRPVMFI